MDYRQCRTCGELLEVSTENYYLTPSAKGGFNFASPDCRPCYLKKDRLERERKKDEDQCGSNTVYAKPNKYADEIQRSQTFQFLTLLGWKFNEEKGIWYDDIKKTKDGEFIGVWAYTPKKNRTVDKLTEETFKPLKFSEKAYRRDKSKDELVQLMLKDYFIYSLKQTDIAEKYSVAVSVVKYYVKLYIDQMNGVYPKRDVKPNITRPYKSSRVAVSQLPKIRLVHQRLKDKYTQEFINQIQQDYFINTMKYREVLEKYAEDECFAKYIIHKTMQIIKLKKNE